MLRTALVATFIAVSSAASAASPLAAELKSLAQAEQGEPSIALRTLTYREAIDVLDELTHADYRRLSHAMANGRLDLPRSVRQALELKAPRLNQRGAGR